MHVGIQFQIKPGVDARRDDLEKAPKEIWSELRPAHSSKTTKTNLTRWFGFFFTLAQYIVHFHLRVFVMVHLAIQLGLLEKGWGESGLVGALQGKGASAEDGKTPVNRGSSEIAALRKATKNSLHLSVVVLSDYQTYSFLRLLLAAVRPVLDWYHNQSETLRSCSASQQWLMGQVLCDFGKSLVAIIGVLHDAVALEKMDLICGGGQGHAQDLRRRTMAGLLCRLQGKLVLQRLRRFSHVVAGWPVRSCLLAWPEAEVASAIAREVLADDDYDQEARQKGRGTFWSKVNKRSVFNWTATRQLVLVLREAGNTVTDDVAVWARNTYSAVIGSKGSEDGICTLRRKEEKAKNWSPGVTNEWA